MSSTVQVNRVELGLLPAATLLLHHGAVDPSGADVPVPIGPGPLDARGLYCLEAALMDLALRGRVRLDPRPATARLVRARSRFGTRLARARRSLGSAVPGLLLLGIGLGLALAVTGHPAVVVPVTASMLACCAILGVPASRADEPGRGHLLVVDWTSTGDEALDELLGLMAGRQPRSAGRWLLATRAYARSVQAKAERVLLQLDCLVRTEARKSLLGLVDTFVMDRSQPTWQALRGRLRATLIDGQPPDPLVSALLLWLTILPTTFVNPRHAGLPGKRPGRTVQGIHHLVAEPELPAARSRLREVTASPELVRALGEDPCATLLAIRWGVTDAIVALKST